MFASYNKIGRKLNVYENDMKQEITHEQDSGSITQRKKNPPKKISRCLAPSHSQKLCVLLLSISSEFRPSSYWTHVQHFINLVSKYIFFRQFIKHVLAICKWTWAHGTSFKAVEHNHETPFLGICQWSDSHQPKADRFCKFNIISNTVFALTFV